MISGKDGTNIRTRVFEILDVELKLLSDITTPATVG
jgi:hypothetical protein